MKRALWSAALLLLSATSAYAFSAPTKPQGFVNDYANVLSANSKTQLETELSQFEQSTSNEIAVAIVPDMGGNYIEDYAVKLFAQWGIGKKDRDNGVLLLIAIAEKKIRIEVGYGLEGALPDSVAQSIINTDMSPRIRAGDFDGAVSAAVHDIEKATQGEYKGTGAAKSSIVSKIDIETWLFFVFFFFQFFAAVLARSKSWWAGGLVGFGIGVVLYFVFALTVAVGASVALGLTGIGLLFDYVVSKAYKGSVASGNRPPWWIGGGGFGGGSGSGFGGGRSGGGGASGGW